MHEAANPDPASKCGPADAAGDSADPIFGIGVRVIEEPVCDPGRVGDYLLFNAVFR